MALMMFALIIVCLLLLNLRYIRLVLRDIGVTFCIVGVLFVLMGFAFSAVFSVILNVIIRFAIIENFASVIRGGMFRYGLIALGVGVVLVIAGVIMTRRFENAYFDNRV